jgi:hypothetical protein
VSGGGVWSDESLARSNLVRASAVITRTPARMAVAHAMTRGRVMLMMKPHESPRDEPFIADALRVCQTTKKSREL